MSRGKIWCALLAIALVLMSAPFVAPQLVGDASARESSPSKKATSDAQGAPDKGEVPTMLVLDSSGSMREADAGGQTRLDAAKDATNDLIDELDGTTPLGMVTYGGVVEETPDNRTQVEGCKDIHLIGGPTKDSKSKLTSAVKGLEAKGYTPIGESLRTAAKELEGKAGTIVLISDGLDTCAPPPVCEVAKELHDQGIDLVINTIGFNVDDKAREELTCIAEAGGGEYTDATDADTLTARMKEAAGRSAAFYESDAEEIQGSDTEEDAPMLPRTKQGEDLVFRTKLKPSEDPDNVADGQKYQYWELPVRSGEHYAVSGVKLAEPDQSHSAGTLFVGADFIKSNAKDDYEARRCTLDEDRYGDTYYQESNQYFSAYSSETGSEYCDGKMLLRVHRKGKYAADRDLEVEMLLHRVDPVENQSELPAEIDSELKGEIHADKNNAKEVTAGRWFTDATEITPGETVQTNIVEGESQFYKVNVKEGQQLVATARMGQQSDEKELRYSIANIVIMNPLRMKAGDSESFIWPKGGDEEQVSADRPVAFNHRFGGQNGNGVSQGNGDQNWKAGDYIVKVELRRNRDDYDASAQRATLDYFLKAEVVGDEIEGPKYAEAAATEDKDSGVLQQDSSDQAAAPEDESFLSKFGIYLGLAGIVVLAAIAAIVVLLRRI